jgi:hypothetical protein
MNCGLLLRVGVVCGILAQTMPSLGDLAPEIQLAGRTVRLGLIKTADRSSVEWPTGETEIITEIFTAGTDTNVTSRISSNGIFPDSGAYSIIYDLNPGITNLGSIPSGTRVVLPKVSPSRQMRQELAGGAHFIILLPDPELHQKLADSIALLDHLKPQFQDLPAARFSDSAKRDSLLNNVDDAIAWFDHIRLQSQQRKGPPTSKETLVTLVDEATALAVLLQRDMNGIAQISQDDERQAAAIHKDLEREIRRYDDVMSGDVPNSDIPLCCLIDVQILGASPKELENVRIYFTKDGLFHNPPPSPTQVRAFPNLGNGRSDKMKPMDYRVWVAPDGKPNDLLTEGALLVQIYPGDTEKEVQLRLKTSGSAK